MKPRHHIVNKGESFITDADGASLNVQGLKDDIVIACHNASKHRSGLCRASDRVSIHGFLGNMLPAQENAAKGAVQVLLLGGTDSDESGRQLEEIILALEAFDAQRDVLNIISADIIRKPHPESFSMAAGDGVITRAGHA